MMAKFHMVEENIVVSYLVENERLFLPLCTVFSERLEEFNYTIRRANRTRWNSQFQTNDLILNSKDRKVLAEFVFLFELFNEATVLTQGESYATICLVAPTVLGILFDLERELGSSTLALVSLCEALIASIKARFSGLLRYFEIGVRFNTYCMSERFSNVIFLISPLYDARFKLLWLDSFHTLVKLCVVE
ncbi:unnamed protein product [Rotaria socialis]